MSNTRFSPTVNGLLHIGHIYTVLVNERTAHASGGKFIVRFDDNQVDWLNTLGALQMAHYAEMVKQDLGWLEIPVDKYCSQSEMEGHSDFQRAMRAAHVTKGAINPDHYPHDITTATPQYPYHEYLTAEKVYMDAMDNVTSVIRGVELKGEYALYCHYRTVFGLTQIPHYYIGRLMDSGGEMADVSKTQGNHKIATYRAQGATPKEVLGILARSCLIDHKGAWHVENLRPQPKLVRVMEYD